MLKFYNFLTRQKEKFTPINPPHVGLYTCGPTVYDYAHIGNLRTFIFEDLLRRVLQYNGFQVRHVMNITDVEDKIIKRARKESVDFKDITTRFTKTFKNDINQLNILPAHNFPTVTEHISDIIDFVKKLEDKGFAYQSDDGSVYFDISRSQNYGQLAQLKRQDLQKGGSGRIKADEYERDAVGDFALWKVQSNAEEPAWDSPWGKGRPGWHIECSVLSMKFLGESFDIHTGAVDLIFPHHTNEIAQSEAVSDEKFVNYWVEGEHLLVDGSKMSKSRGNYYTLREIEQRGFDPLSFRYLCLTTHYRSKLNFTWESLKSAQKALQRLRRVSAGLVPAENNVDTRRLQGSQPQEVQDQFLSAINNDLDFPKALSLVWGLIKGDFPARLKLPTLLKFDEVLGLRLAQVAVVKEVEIPVKVEKLVRQREKLRQQGEFEKADELREKIQQNGFTVEDTPHGPRILT